MTKQAVLGLDTDCGSEFIYELLDYCEDRLITFTRARTHRKNDQAHVEMAFLPLQTLDEDQQAALTFTQEDNCSRQFPIDFEMHYTDVFGPRQYKTLGNIRNHAVREIQGA